MDSKKDLFRSPIEVFSQTKEQTVETDLLLPDYFPEIAKILDCSISLSEDAVTQTADKISIAGAATVRLLYASDENELRVYETETKYTKLISGGSFLPADICTVEQSVSSLNFRAVSPRKVEVRASAAVKLHVTRMEEVTYLGDVQDDSVEVKIVPVNAYEVSSVGSVRMEIEDKISLPAEKSRIRGFLRQDVNIVFNEIKTVTNKIMLNGTAEVTFVYITDNNGISAVCGVSLPFTQIRELYGTADGDMCSVSVSNADVQIDIKNGGSDTEADVRIRVFMTVITGHAAERRILQDAYSVKNDVQLEKVNAEMPVGIYESRETVHISGEAQTYDIDVKTVCDKSICDLEYSVMNVSEGKKINGSFTLKLLVMAADGSYNCISRSCSFEYLCSLPEDTSIWRFGLTPQALNVEPVADGIRWSGELQLNYISVCGMHTPLIREIGLLPRSERNDSQNIVLYYGAAGESVWEIAKENRTTLNSITVPNSLTEDILKEDRLLVFRT